MNLYDRYTDALEKVSSELDQYRHLPLPELHGTLDRLRKDHQAASQQGLFSRLKNRSQNKARGRQINALGSALSQDPLGPKGEMIYLDGDGTEHFGPRNEIYKKYQKERPEDRALVASILAEHVGDRYADMVDARIHGAQSVGDEHWDAGRRLWSAQHKPGGAQLADAYMKKHFSGGHKKVAAGSFRKAFDPLRDQHSLFTYFDGDRNIHDDLTRQQVYERYLKEKPENRVDVARNMAHNTSYLYRMQEDHGLRGRLLARKHGKHVDASNRLLGHEDKPGGHVAADAYMKRHFS